MTTIVYKDGVLAGDSLMSVNGELSHYSKKVFNIDGYLLGVAGWTCTIDFFRDWVKENCDPDVLNGLDHDYTILVVPPKGAKIYLYTSHTKVLRDTLSKKKPYCIGSGSSIAVGALQMGATAEEAVKAAINIDLYSGGRVHTVSNLDE